MLINVILSIMKRYFFTTLFLAAITLSTSAKVKLPQLISDNMVLQQEADVCLWGEATPSSTITIKAGWTNRSVETKADANGCWKTTVATPSASFRAYDLSINDGEEVLIHNVLIGEVWFCSGQSNMEMPIAGFGNCPIKDSNNIIADGSNHAAIHMATIEKKSALTPQEYANGKWKVSSPENVPGFSATAYNYALALQRTLQVPIGIINCSWGGSRVEGWLPKEILQTYKDEDLSKAGSKEGIQYMQPMIMYNGMLYACIHYTIKGFAWYQGCSNVDTYKTYADRLATMVKHWRSLWGQGDIPFYYVEIAPFSYGDPAKTKGAMLREQQYKALALIPNSGMISTNDLVQPYEVNQIHPCDKKDVGERLAYQALNKTYGFTSIKADGPMFKEMKVEGNKACITFTNADEGFSPWDGITGFEVAGADKVFKAAKAVVNTGKNRIEVTSDEVSQPVAVRYCFRNFQIGNLKNNRNLPTVPFRTDNWDE